MFSGKSEELIRRLRRAQIARQKVQIFKPTLDNRFSHGQIVSHSDMRIPSQNVASSDELRSAGGRRHRGRGHRRGAVLRRQPARRVQHAGRRGKRVMVAGLDQDYLGRPFEPMPQLLAIAEYITKTLAICVVCGDPANHTQRLVASSDRVLVGASGLYEARCRHCFDPTLAGAESHRTLEGVNVEVSVVSAVVVQFPPWTCSRSRSWPWAPGFSSPMPG